MSSTLAAARRRIVMTGAVQGVGMRPFIHRLATELGLAGFVGNDAGGTFVEVEGSQHTMEAFARRLVEEAPRLARIESVAVSAIAARGERGFSIVQSGSGGGSRTSVPPDTATCDLCLSEIRDPSDRRFRHPFANCTDCGPRFTIIRGLPYDRPMTTMAAFALCADCAAEYADPADRRHHAQPISCPKCGPQLRFRGRGGEVSPGTDAAIAAVQEAWARGQVVAVKGIGGYHLTCDAGDDAAVSLLRERKGRGGKPFAVMVRDAAAATALAQLGPRELAALRSPARPIVIAVRLPDAGVAPSVAPDNPDLGIMLAYSGIHELLLSPVPGGAAEPPRVIVATSGNRTSEPICTGDEEAVERLGDIADAFLMHDRGIHVACDDSVIRIVGAGEQPIRRSRGYAPLPVPIAVELLPTLAVGGELKSTFALACGAHAWMSQHIGDVENLETLEALERSVSSFCDMYRIDPEIIAVDAHPGYLSRRWAIEHRSRGRVVEVRHHHAHVAALMAEHGLDGSAPIIGVAFDGTGYGSALAGGPAIWGGEVLVADFDGFSRAGHLAELPLPGGDAAVRDPWRVAIAFATAAGIDLDDRCPSVRAGGESGHAIVAQQVRRGVGVVATTSAGRLFDAVASLLGVRHEVSYEAQAAIELEAAARRAQSSWPLRFGCDEDGVIDSSPLLAELVSAQARGGAPDALARGFHEALADAVADVARMVSAATGIRTAGLTGGVFQNGLLSELCRSRLAGLGLEVLEHRVVPANDGGLALGQAVIAARSVAAPTRRW